MLNLMSICLIDGKLEEGGVDFPTSVLWIICLSEKKENPVNPTANATLITVEILQKYREKTGKLCTQLAPLETL